MKKQVYIILSVFLYLLLLRYPALFWILGFVWLLIYNPWFFAPWPLDLLAIVQKIKSKIGLDTEARKYIYRVAAAFFLSTLLNYFFGNGHLFRDGFSPFLLFAFLLMPLYEWGQTSVFVPIIEIAFYGSLAGFPLYLFLKNWFSIEMENPDIVIRKKINKIAICISVMPALFMIVPAFTTYKYVVNKTEQKEKLLNNVSVVNIENYKETPFYQWGSQSPVGLEVEFDLVGENQRHLLVNIVSMYNSTNLYDPRSSSSRGSQCLPHDAAMEAARINLGGEFVAAYLKDRFLLMEPDRNHVTFRCYSPFVSKDIFNDTYVKLSKKAELIRDAEEAIENKISQDRKNDITVSLDITRHC